MSSHAISRFDHKWATSLGGRAGQSSQQPLLLSERAYRQIKEKIITLELPPASVINEKALQAELGMGRTPIREALNRLVADKLVVIIPRRGTMVADVRLTDLQHIFDVRLPLECLAAREAALNIRPEELQAMEGLLARSADIVERQDRRALTELDRQFQRLMYQATRKGFLFETLDWLYGLSLRIWHLALHRIERFQETVDGLSSILAALQARDPNRAETAVRCHVTEFHQHIRSFV